MLNSEMPKKGTQPVDALCDESYLHVELVDGRVISVPTAWIPALEGASATERNSMEFLAASLLWPDLGAEIQVSTLLCGRDAIRKATSSQIEINADALLRSVSERLDQ
ncbi:DUF2442 domain-containing protein [Agrobacterium sp. ES01]|uniref:DUF2442 domain-containing protein n=1 Tax=Agrobacterium sp. ES01 TaxID=3420714 RepID=UPI003D14F096